MAINSNLAKYFTNFDDYDQERADSDGPVANWLLEARKSAIDRLHSSGLPCRRDEYWRYTDPAKFHKGKDWSNPSYQVPILLPKAYRVVADHFDYCGFTSAPLTNAIVMDVRECAKSDDNLASRIYGKLEAKASSMIPRGFATANTAIANNGLVLEFLPRTNSSVQLQHRPKIVSAGKMSHHIIDVKPGATAVIAETGHEAIMSNTVYEIRVGAGAKCRLIRAAAGNSPAGNSAVCSVFADVESGGSFNFFSLSAWMPKVRNECVVRLKGDYAKANLAGAAIGGEGGHHDDTVLVIHEGQHCESRQVYKKVLRKGAKGVFQGKILVRPNAQKTDGYQISQGLLLDDKSQFLAKPELEIYADDVACSHGSTSGGVNDDAMFYLRSRGVRKAKAKKLLALAFLADAINEVPKEDGQENLTQLASRWFSGRN